MNKHLRPAELPVSEDDDFLKAVLESASIPTIMMSIVHMTGDTSLLRGPICPGRVIMGESQGFLDAEQKAEVRATAFEALKTYRDRGCTLPDPPSRETVQEMMSFMVGEAVPDAYAPMMLEEMALDGEDLRVVHIDEEAVGKARERVNVVVIGAGMSGLLAAIRLEEAGVEYCVIEKNSGVGGTWFENVYPGARVDIGNHFYCYSFEPNHDWSQYFSAQPELHDYFERCADDYDVRKNIRFETEVTEARFDEPSSRWHVTIQDGSGRQETLSAAVVISAVGQLNRPLIPNIPGLDSFEGASFHSAEWQAQHDLSGKRVAVIGSGASALQLVPEVGKQAGHLSVFQRSPAWMFPNPNYHGHVSDAVKWLLKHVPYYGRWYRFLIFWPGSDGLLPSLVVDPEWPHQERSINALNEATREVFTNYLKEQVGDDPELLAKVLPTYPPFGKRMLQDNGNWLSTLKRDNVELVTTGVERITATGVIPNGGEEIPADIIIFATGFHANRFLWPIDVIGREGVELGELWGDDPRAYLGITVPKFPNLFCLYGPATNLAHAGSIIFHSECQVRYIMGCIKALMERDLSSMECKQEVNDDFNDKLDEALAGMVWSHPGMNSWYKNSKGRVTTTSPWRLLDYWNWTQAPDLNDFELR